VLAKVTALIFLFEEVVSGNRGLFGRGAMEELGHQTLRLEVFEASVAGVLILSKRFAGVDRRSFEEDVHNSGDR
jgi:hypothetical protein